MRPEALAVEALREYLLAKLPAKVAALNATRKATLKSALQGPFVITSGMTLTLSPVGHEAVGTAVLLTTGTRTAAQVAADINTASVVGITASDDSAGRLVLTATAIPAPGAPSVICVQSDGDTGVNALFGWESGGEHLDRAALVAPSWRGVVDGEWLVAPDMGGGFWVALRDRASKQVEPDRRGEFLVTIPVEVVRPFGSNATPHRDREAISACLQAVREIITDTSEGRQLGRAAQGDVQYVRVTAVNIAAEPFAAPAKGGAFFDVAGMTVTVRIFQPPSGP